MASLYLWLKALHIIFVVALMAGLLIYPRYKVHQLAAAPGEPLFESMKDASARLRRIILSPSLVLVWAFGFAMVYVDWRNGGAIWAAGWLHAKLALALALGAIHGWLIGVGRKIDEAAPTIDRRRLKLMNEVPFLLMIGIILLVVLKPFS